MKVVTYRVRLLQPVLATALGGEPNSAVSAEFVPGSALRGAVIGRYLRRHGLRTLDVADPATRRLFLDGSTRYLHAYPCDPRGDRCLPVPASWRRQKGEENAVWDLAADDPDTPRGPWQSAGAPFWYPDADGDGAVAVTPRRQVAIHVQRDRIQGRPTQDAGAVYRYEALAAGSKWCAAVVCEADADAEAITGLLPGDVWLGGARTAGYGLACVDRECVRVASAPWREVRAPLDDASDQPLAVTLLSDAVVRDGAGQVRADAKAFTAALAAALEFPDLQLESAFLRSRVAGGFNRTWGLPLPQAEAIAAGSVFVYRAGPWTTARLERAEWRGVGARRAEGFGRLLCQRLAEPQRRIHPHMPERPAAAVDPDPEAQQLAADMAQRLLHDRIEAHIAARAAQLAERAKPRPSRAQIGRLRAAIAAQVRREEPDLAGFLKFVGRLEARPVLARGYEAARIGHQRLLPWLKDQLTHGEQDEDQAWWTLLGEARRVPRVADVPARLTPAARCRYLLLWVDAVLAAIAKQPGPGEEGDQ